MKSENYKEIFNTKKQPILPLSIKEVSSSRSINEKLEEKCRVKWKNILKDAEENNQMIWDSEVYRFEGIAKNGDGFELSVSTIPFSVRYSMNSFTNDISKLGIEYAPLGMFASCFLLTADNKYVFIEKSGKYHSSRKYSFVGGILSKSEREVRKEKDILKEVKKEIREEVGIEEGDISSIELKAGYITQNFNFCLVVRAKIDKDFDNVVRKFDEMDVDESFSLVGINKEELPDFAEEKLLAKDMPKLELLNLI
jgi:hypothetical protein